MERIHEQKRSRKALDFEQISSLHQKKKNLFSFIESLGDLAFQPIRLDILDHCEKVAINLSTGLTREVVTKLAKNRVEKYSFPELRMIKNKRIKKNWSEEDIKILVWVISKYCQMQRIDSIKD